LQQLDLPRLAGAAGGAVIVLRARIGDTLQDGAVVAGLHGGDASAAVLAALVTGPERTFGQDPLFAFRLAPGLPLPAGPQGPSVILGIGPCTGGVVRHPPRFLPTRSWDAGVPLRDPWAGGQMSLRMSRERRWVVGQMPQPTELGSRHTAA
jgi:hypothetical protein